MGNVQCSHIKFCKSNIFLYLYHQMGKEFRVIIFYSYLTFIDVLYVVKSSLRRVVNLYSSHVPTVIYLYLLFTCTHCDCVHLFCYQYYLLDIIVYSNIFRHICNIICLLYIHCSHAHIMTVFICFAINIMYWT